MEPPKPKRDPEKLIWDQLDEAASKAKRDTYDDPVSGRMVFTSYYLQKRGSCCGSGCRHCPYGDRLKP
ncbi:MAG: hypothetical protein KDD66_08135 [Bdellovibrionales bacterium]|nr:hypothetical protein [Bdellovibrionales bacterium]